MRRFVIMGVSGCGKSSVGAGLAQVCGLAFIDGDSLHPPANIAKMSSGQPLDDADRGPWLVAVGQVLAAAQGPLAVGCSALKRRYRDVIRAQSGQAPVHFLHLAAPKVVLAARVAARQGHFMPPALLDSQYAALEPLDPDEPGLVIDIDRPIEAIVADAARYVREAAT